MKAKCVLCLGVMQKLLIRRKQTHPEAAKENEISDTTMIRMESHVKYRKLSPKPTINSHAPKKKTTHTHTQKRKR